MADLQDTLNENFSKRISASVSKSLRKEGYNQVEIDNLFQCVVLPKILYGLLE